MLYKTNNKDYITTTSKLNTFQEKTWS